MNENGSIIIVIKGFIVLDYNDITRVDLVIRRILGSIHQGPDEIIAAPRIS